MSIYCTLPRRHPFSGINQRRNTVVSAEEARKLVDELFNPIVDYDCDQSNDQTYGNPTEHHNSIRVNRVDGHEEPVYGNYGSNYSEAKNYMDLSQKYSSVVRSSKSDHTLSGVGVNTGVDTRVTTNATNNKSNINKNISVNNSTNNCKNGETSYDSSTKLYYAFDNFEDFRRRRKSLAPDFYGGGLTPSLYGTDSAYESSSPSIESLKSDQKLKKKSKYFTLPTRRSTGKTRLKDNVHEIAKRLSNNHINTANHMNGSNKSTTDYSNYSTALSLLPNKMNANQTLNSKYVPKNSVNHQEFHCCCRSGCHLNNSIHSDGNTVPHTHTHTPGLGLHCCQQILETLWEEPTVEASALVRSRRSMSSDFSNPWKGSNKKIEAHMVAAFEQSLSSMTARLHQLNTSLELKDCEMDRLRHTIESMKKQGSLSDTNHTSKQSSNSSNANKVKTASLIRRHTFTNEGKGEDSNSRISRQLSVESVSSVSSGADSSISHKSKKKSEKSFNHSSSGWLRSSFSKAFKKNKSIVKRDALSDAEFTGNEGDASSVPNSPYISFRPDHRTNGNDLNESEVVQELRRQLREKDMVLTDLRLESLTSAHQLENLKETVNQLRAEMLNLKQDNDRLKRLVSSKSLASSQSSMTSGIYGQNSHPTYGSTFLGRQNGNHSENDGNSIKSLEMEAVTNALLCDGGKFVTVETGTHIIASLVVTPKTNWEQLDLMIKKSFKNYINRIDSGLGLGLTLDALACYQVGSEKIQRDIVANKSVQPLPPELLPFGYIVNESHIFVQFKSPSDSLVFDTLTPKSIIQRYINLLNEHRRIILCGPSGTGKTNMAHKLAEYLAIKRAIDNQHPGTSLECCPVGSIATFSVDHKSAKELRAYLTNVAEQCESETLSLHLPTVIILDNLHHVGSIDEVFNGLINITHTKCLCRPSSPFIIGTMNQTTCTTANLQLHHNFRWVLCTNSMEPVKGFLGRFLKRKLIEYEVKMASNNLAVNPELNKIIDWIPKLWSHLNQFLESHSSSDVTIGPRLFSSCPIDISGSQVWFTDLWNYSIIPYVIEATREGIQMYGQRTPFVDPSEWVREAYPWSASGDLIQHLLQIRAEDVNYENLKENNCNESESLAQSSSDPLLNMLRRLQEAANHSANYSDSSQPNQSYNQNNGNPNNNMTSVSIVNSGIESTL